MKKNLISGLIFLLPLTITVLAVIFLVDLLTTPFFGYVEGLLRFMATKWHWNLVLHPKVLMVSSRIIALIMIFFVILFLGFLGQRLFFNWVGKTVHLIMMKIPLINRVYKICRDIISAVLSEEQKLFKGTVTVPFPTENTRLMGALMGDAPREVLAKVPGKAGDKKMQSIFCATSPHPISGFLFLCDQNVLHTVDLSTEELFKFLISCGIYTPGKPDSPPEN